MAPSQTISREAARAPGDPLRPAFRNDFHAAAFLLLLIVALAMPVVLAHVHAFDRQYRYIAMREDDGAFSWVRHEIFDVKDDVDILFAGNSTLWAGIDAPIVEESLTRKLGRRARAVTFGSYWPGLEVPYMEIRHALEHKHVGMVVLSVPRTGFNDGPSPVGFRFLTYSDPPGTTAGLPFRYRVALYAGYVLRSPRDVLNALRPVRSIPSTYAAANGSMVAEQGFENARYTRFDPPAPDVTADSLTYSGETANFEFTGDVIPPFQMYYLRKIVDLLQAKHVGLVLLSIPQYTDRLSGQAIERQCWPCELGTSAAMVGIPPAVLFRGMNDADVRKLYYDKVHLNRNGSDFFTRTVAPALLELYVRKLYVDDSKLR